MPHDAVRVRTGDTDVVTAGGGFLMFYAPEERHDEIAQALNFLRRVDFRFDPLGSRIIFYNPTPNDRNLEYDLQTNLRWQELNPHTKMPEPWDDTYTLDSN